VNLGAAEVHEVNAVDAKKATTGKREERAKFDWTTSVVIKFVMKTIKNTILEDY
jgi:hypothetical protein